MTQPHHAEIHDLGYRAYDGERRGPAWATWALVIHSMQRALGLKRAARHKVLPVVILVIAYLPAVVFVGLAVFIGDELESDALPSYGDFLGTLTFALLLFSSFVAPEVLCTDRLTGMLGLYLASPLDRTSYLLAKVASVVAVLAIMTVGPLVMLLSSYSLVGTGPGGFGYFADLGRILVAGILLALFFTVWSLAISSLTPRRGVASAAIVVTMLVSIFLSGVLLESADGADEVELINIPGAGFELSERVLEGRDRFAPEGIGRVGDLPVAATVLGSIVVLGGFLVWRYRTMEIER